MGVAYDIETDLSLEILGLSNSRSSDPHSSSVRLCSLEVLGGLIPIEYSWGGPLRGVADISV